MATSAQPAAGASHASAFSFGTPSSSAASFSARTATPKAFWYTQPKGILTSPAVNMDDVGGPVAASIFLGQQAPGSASNQGLAYHQGKKHVKPPNCGAKTATIAAAYSGTAAASTDSDFGKMPATAVFQPAGQPAAWQYPFQQSWCTVFHSTPVGILSSSGGFTAVSSSPVFGASNARPAPGWTWPATAARSGTPTAAVTPQSYPLESSAVPPTVLQPNATFTPPAAGPSSRLPHPAPQPHKGPVLAQPPKLPEANTRPTSSSPLANGPMPPTPSVFQMGKKSKSKTGWRKDKDDIGLVDPAGAMPWGAMPSTATLPVFSSSSFVPPPVVSESVFFAGFRFAPPPPVSGHHITSPTTAPTRPTAASFMSTSASAPRTAHVPFQTYFVPEPTTTPQEASLKRPSETPTHTRASVFEASQADTATATTFHPGQRKIAKKSEKKAGMKSKQASPIKPLREEPVLASGMTGVANSSRFATRHHGSTDPKTLPTEYREVQMSDNEEEAEIPAAPPLVNTALPNFLLRPPAPPPRLTPERDAFMGMNIGGAAMASPSPDASAPMDTEAASGSNPSGPKHTRKKKKNKKVAAHADKQEDAASNTQVGCSAILL